MTEDTRDFATLEKDGWNEPETARSYASVFATAAEQVVPALVDGARASPGCRALDLCCGHGIVAEGLVAAGAQVTGVDFSAPMLDLARRRVPDAEFAEGDAMALAFDASSFDAVTIGFGIPHVPDPPHVFAEVRRVLKPGGWLAYSVWDDCKESALAYVFGAIAQHGAPGITLPPGPGASDYANTDIAFPALRTAGFSDITMQRVDSRWDVDDPGAPFDYFHEGTVRGGALLRVQPDDCRQAIRDAVVEQVLSCHGRDAPWSVPIPAVVVTARAA